jgi:hypothetical protein
VPAKDMPWLKSDQHQTVTDPELKICKQIGTQRLQSQNLPLYSSTFTMVCTKSLFNHHIVFYQMDDIRDGWIVDG